MPGHNLSKLRIYSQNVNRNYSFLSNLLEMHKFEYDILFIQEPSWRFIRRTVSSSNLEGDVVIGLPIHPDWLTFFHRPSDDDDIPRVAGLCQPTSIRVLSFF